jgi:hypothetical protein
MIKGTNSDKSGGKLLLIFCSILVLMTIYQRAVGQERPPRPLLLVVTAEELRFGAFVVVTGGTINIDPGGGRSVGIGLIGVNLGYVYGPATFRVKGNAGTLVTIQDIPPTFLYNGGFKLGLSFNTPISTVSSLGSPFILQNSGWIDLKIGGTLTVGNSASNPPGPYIGTFNLTLIQQ